MYKFNYTKMNRVLDDIKLRLSTPQSISDAVIIIGGAMVFFEESLDKATNLDNKLKIDYVNYFYRELFNIVTNLNVFDLNEAIGNLIIKNIDKRNKLKKTNPYYMLTMDIYMITALIYLQNNNVDKAKEYFIKAITFGEKYINESKKDYHNVLCCGTNWLGYIYKQENKLKDALEYYEETYKLYESVKDEKGFYFKEYDPEDVILTINKLKEDIK